MPILRTGTGIIIIRSLIVKFEIFSIQFRGAVSYTSRGHCTQCAYVYWARCWSLSWCLSWAWCWSLSWCVSRIANWQFRTSAGVRILPVAIPDPRCGCSCPVTICVVLWHLETFTVATVRHWRSVRAIVGPMIARDVAPLTLHIAAMLQTLAPSHWSTNMLHPTASRHWVAVNRPPGSRHTIIRTILGSVVVALLVVVVVDILASILGFGAFQAPGIESLRIRLGVRASSAPAGRICHGVTNALWVFIARLFNLCLRFEDSTFTNICSPEMCSSMNQKWRICWRIRWCEGRIDRWIWRRMLGGRC